MTCEKCRKQQESDYSAFIRWGKSNIEIRGCDKCLRKIFGKLFDSDYSNRIIFRVKMDRLIKEKGK